MRSLSIFRSALRSSICVVGLVSCAPADSQVNLDEVCDTCDLRELTPASATFNGSCWLDDRSVVCRDDSMLPGTGGVRVAVRAYDHDSVEYVSIPSGETQIVYTLDDVEVYPVEVKMYSDMDALAARDSLMAEVLMDPGSQNHFSISRRQDLWPLHLLENRASSELFLRVVYDSGEASDDAPGASLYPADIMWAELPSQGILTLESRYEFQAPVDSVEVAGPSYIIINTLGHIEVAGLHLDTPSD